jgi:hypothetical protein
MANASYGNVLYCDTVGIISKTPVRIKAIEVDPSSVDGLVLFNYWDESNAATTLAMTASVSTGTVTNDDTAADVLTSANFPDGSVVKVIKSSGAAANMTYHLIGTAGNDDRIVITPTSTWADENNKYYTIASYPARRAFGIATRHVDLCNEFRYFGDEGIWFPNLILETATNAVATIYLAGR